jgi:hypothetical protein
MNNDPEYIAKWKYIRPGDMLEYTDKQGNVKQIGPVTLVDWRPGYNNFTPLYTRKYVLVPSLHREGVQVDVPLMRVSAVFRNNEEKIRFQEGEITRFLGFSCATCWQRPANISIPGKVFCSIHCMEEWCERYYQGYAPGDNPIDRGEHINTANCDSCRKINRAYCEKCVD